MKAMLIFNDEQKVQEIGFEISENRNFMKMLAPAPKLIFCLLSLFPLPCRTTLIWMKTFWPGW